MLTAFQSALLVAKEYDRGVADLGRLLGRPPAWQGIEGTTGAPSALFPVANTILEVRGPATAVPGADGEPEARAAGSVLADEGLRGIRLAVDDLSAARPELVRRGLASAPIRHERAVGTGGAPERAWRAMTLDLARSRSIPVELVSDEVDWSPCGAADEVDRSSLVEALDHVVVFSADLEATRAFYGSGLGIRLALDRSFEARGVRLLFFRLGGVTIEIGGRLGAEPRSDARDRFGGLAWRVPDVGAARERLTADGFDVSDVRVGHKPGTRVCSVRAPVHGVPTLLIEPAPTVGGGR